MNTTVLSTTQIAVVDYTLSGQQEFISMFLVEKIYKLIITVVGLIGNGVTIIILSKKRNRNSSTAVYLSALAISDIFILIFGPFCDWLQVMFKVIITEYGDFACKLQTFMQYASSSTSSWLLVAVTIERAICVTFPHRVKSSCTTRLAMIIVIVTWTVVYVANLHFLFGMGHTYNKVCKAIASAEYIKFSTVIFPWVDFCLCFAIPGLLILIGNTVIIYQLGQYHARQKHFTQGRSKRNLSVSLILVSVNFAFLITAGPIYIFTIIFPYLEETLGPDSNYSLQYFWGPMLNSLWETNAALNIVLYVVSGSKFRNELCLLLCCKKYQRPSILGLFETKTPMNRIYMRSTFRNSDAEDPQSENTIQLLQITNHGH